MNRSLLQPIRTRRYVPAIAAHPCARDLGAPAMTAGTRRTLAAIGTLWVSFATSSLTQPALPGTATAQISGRQTAPTGGDALRSNAAPA